MKDIIDLTGKKIRHWTVINKDIIKNNRIYWHCKCECGHESNIMHYNLINNKSRNCKKCKPISKTFGINPSNKLNINTIKNEKFGSLNVIAESNPQKISGQFRRFILCKCDCGNEKNINLQHLISGHTKSCGCEFYRKDEHGFVKNRRKRYKTGSGYIKIYMPNHANSDRNGYVLEHIYVMSQNLQRPIKKGETIHHKNGIRDSNNMENLELWTHTHPYGQRVVDMYEFCLKYIEDYKDIYNSTK